MYLPILFVAAGIFGYSVYLGAPRVIVLNTSAMLASVEVGATASVAPNPYNTVAKQLSDKERLLDQRERDILAQESAKSDSSLGFKSNLPLYSFIMSMVLALLVAVNFYFDLRRARVAKDFVATRSIINMRNQ